MTDDRQSTPKSVEQLEAENAALRRRIEALESRDRRRGDEGRGGDDAYHDRNSERRGWNEPVSRTTRDRLRDVPDRSAEEVDRLSRALTNAAAESARNLSRALNAAADVMFDREDRHVRDEDRVHGRDRYSSAPERRADRRRRRFDHATADDVVAGVATGLLEALDGQRHIVRRFFDAYEDEAGEQENERHSTLESQRERPEPARVVPKGKRATSRAAPEELGTNAP